MLRLSHSVPLRRLLLGAVVLHACAPPAARTPGDTRPPLRSFCTIRLDAEGEEILIARVVAGDTTLRRLDNVLEVGGRLTAMLGDTLVLQLYYLTTRAATADGAPATIFRGRAVDMPDLVLVPMTADVSIQEFRTPGAAWRRHSFPLVLGSLFLLTLLAADAALLLHL